jgi:hypothetical protein
MTAVRAGVLAALALLAPAVARAADPAVVVSGVRVASPACPIAPLAIPQFVDALRVELTGQDTGHGATLVTLAIEPCDPSTTRVLVSVSDVNSQRGSAREIDLGDVAPTARPRALALAVAELVRTTQPPAPEPPPPAPQPPAGPPPVEVSPITRVVAGDALYAAFPARHTALWGGRLSLSAERGHLHAGAFADFLSGDHGYDLGSVTLQSIGAGLFAGPRWAAGRFSVSPGLLGSVAWAHIEGRAGAPDVTARSGDGVAVALRARVLVSWGFGRAMTARALVEAGWMPKGFDALVDGARAAGLSGASIVAGLGLGFGP